MFKILLSIVLIHILIKPIFNISVISGNGEGNQQNMESHQKEAVKNLIERLLQDESNGFDIQIEVSMKNGDKDVFILEKIASNTSSPLSIKASSGVAAAAGFHHYLKYHCSSHVSWDYNQINLTKCPTGGLYEKIQFNDKYRYYQNACTPSYSFVWWDWHKWQQHIDWMAMQGFNLVPVSNGQETIWKKIYLQLGLTEEEIDKHFAGPAFLAWNRMGNLRGWGGPLSNSWHISQASLARKIIKALRSFGITTVLPAFAGQVPVAMKRLYPNATYHELPHWNNFEDKFCCPLLLNPTDALFHHLGSTFLTEMIKTYGSDHIYNCDTFNEMTPYTTDLKELRQIGSSIHSSMLSIDPEAIWLMQGWLFHHELLYWSKTRVKALLTSVPIGKMIILDLQSEQFPQYERLHNYFGQPYIWCMLHNFGGTLGMFGSAEIINNRIFEARNMPNSTLIGTGLTPEGINQNYVIYDLMSEMSYRRKPANLTTWFKNYAIRRYGQEHENITKAWDILRGTVYSFNTSQLMRGKFVYNRSPRTKIVPWSWYTHADLVQAFELFSSAEYLILDNENCLHDYIDLSRQVFQNLMDEYYTNMIFWFKVKDLDNFLQFKVSFLRLFDHVDNILSAGNKWLLGSWIKSAIKASRNEKDAKLFEWNARNQITLWGPNGEIMDYANKQWAGVVKHFFKPRWELFLKHMTDSLVFGRKFNETAARKDVFETVEVPFTLSRMEFPDKATGNPAKIFEVPRLELKKLYQFLQDNKL